MASLTIKFTSAAIHKALSSTPNSTILRDEVLNGLIIRRTSSGEARFAVEKKIDGRIHKQVLWPLAENSRIDEARDAASKIFLSLRDGVDPRRAAHITDLSERTVDEWLEVHKPTTRASTYGQNFSAIKQLGIGKKRLLLDFTPADAFELYDKCRKAEVSESTSRRYISVLRLLFNFACERADLVSSNPFDKLLKQVKSAAPRQEYLNLAELRKLVQSVRLRGGVGADVIEMLVLSGLRLNEVAQMEWAEVSHEQGVITIPAERMKAGRSLIRPITKRMAQIIQSRTQTSKFVFNSDQESNTPSKSSPRTVLSWACKHAGVAVVRPHDLRRSFITVAYGLGLQSVHTAMLVGHAIGSGAHGGYIMRDDAKLKEVAQMIEDAILEP